MMDSPVELGRSIAGEAYGRSSRHTSDEVPLPDGELSHLLTRNPMLDDLPSFDLRGDYCIICFTQFIAHRDTVLMHYSL